MRLNKAILSRGRASDMITPSLLRSFDLVVPESEYGEYLAKCRQDFPHVGNIWKIPNEKIGLGVTRNFCMDIYPKNEPLIMLDDDIIALCDLMGKKMEKFWDPDAVEHVLFNLALNAVDAGARLFSLANTTDIRKIIPHRFFLLSGWVGQIVGVYKNDLRFTEVCKTKVDIDFTLQTLMEYRFVWTDHRYGQLAKINKNLGGSSRIRSRDQVEKEMNYLKEKWGPYINIRNKKSVEHISLSVKRKHTIII